MKKKYSSEIVQALMENTTWNFWRKDWSSRIIVSWDDRKVPLERFSNSIRTLVGNGFLYERSLTADSVQFKVSGNAKKATLNPL